MLFGLAILFFLFALILLAVSAFVGTRGRRRKRTLILTGILLPIELLLLYSASEQAHSWDGWDLHAEFTEQDLPGTWKLGSETMSLRPDGTVISSAGVRGTWSLHDGWFLRITGQEWAILRHRGRLAIVKIRGNDIEHSDPDEWYLGGAFEHEEQAFRPAQPGFQNRRAMSAALLGARRSG
jgi:hypothetical protein